MNTNLVAKQSRFVQAASARYQERRAAINLIVEAKNKIVAARS